MKGEEESKANDKSAKLSTQTNQENNCIPIQLAPKPAESIYLTCYKTKQEAKWTTKQAATMLKTQQTEFRIA